MQKLKDRGTSAVPPKKSASAYIIFGKEVPLLWLTECRNAQRSSRGIRWPRSPRSSRRSRRAGKSLQRRTGKSTRRRLREVSDVLLACRQGKIWKGVAIVGVLLRQSQETQEVPLGLHDIRQRGRSPNLIISLRPDLWSSTHIQRWVPCRWCRR